jgi:hypothetical protein
VTRKLTWTFGVRDTFNSNPLNPHDQVARLRGSFSSIPHDNQPLNTVIQTHLGNLFSSTPVAILQPRTAIAWQFEPKSVLRTGFGIFSDILPGTVADLIGTNPPYDKTFQGGVLGSVGGTAIAPGAPNSAVGAIVAANQTFTSGFPQGQPSLPPVAITAIPDGKLHAPYFMEWSLGIEHQFGTTASLHAQYVGTRAVNQPYSTQVNGYQTVCQGCFAPFPYLQPTDARFAAVTQLSTGANSHYNGLQLTAMKRLGHGLQGQVNYTWSRCMDTVSNGGFLPFSAGGILSPLPGDLARDYGPCDYDIRHNLNAQYVYQLPIRVRSHSLGYALNGWQISGTAFWHSGVPFSVLSTPYSANGKRHCAGQRAAVRQSCAGSVPIAAIATFPRPKRARFSGSIRMLLYRRLIRVQGSAPATAATAAELPIRKPRPQFPARSRFPLERLLPDKMVSFDRACEAAV